jgi:hypothetical protein
MMALSQGEKMVWAAVFANELRKELDSELEEGEDFDYNLCVSCGVDSACEAVRALREMPDWSSWDGIVKERHEEEQENLAMLLAMLGDEAPKTPT